MPDPVAKKFIGPLIVASSLGWLCLGARPWPSQVSFQGTCFKVELAEPRAEQARGLSSRQSLPRDWAMLFVFSRAGEYPFWMKDTLIPLDIIWLDGDKRVVSVKENAQPCLGVNCPLFYPGKEAQYVLEINAGSVKRLGLIEGEIMSFK